MRAPALQSLRAFVAELGPLLWVALFTAVVPTVGLFVVLAWLPALAAAWPPGWTGWVLLGGAIVPAVGCVLLPPSICAFTAGYVLGPAGALPALLGIGVAGVFGQCCVWPLLGPGVYAFARARPRVHAVRAFCTAPGSATALRVAVLRGAARLPFAVVSLLLSLAAVSPRAVWLGSTVAAVPVAWVASAAGNVYRPWREDAPLPGTALTNLGLAAAAAVAAALVARRRRAAGDARS